MTPASEFHQWARWYAKQGYPVFPLAPGSKVPKKGSHGFKDATTDPGQIDQWWTEEPDSNIGIPTGEASRTLVIDIDVRHGGPATRADFQEDYGPIPDRAAEQITGRGDGSRHIVMHYEGGKVPEQIGPGVELKGPGDYIVVHPSIHPDTGGRYEWDGEDGAKALQNPATVPAWLQERIRRAQQQKKAAESSPQAKDEKWTSGERNSKLTSFAGGLRRKGLSREIIEAALLEENRKRCNPPLPEREVKKIAESVSQYPPGENGPTATDTEQPWPDPEPINTSLPPVQKFDPEWLPSSFGALIQDIATRMQVAVDFVAAALLVALAGCIGRRVRIHPKKYDTSWVVIPNLFGGIVALPGRKKTPVIQMVLRPVERVQALWRNEYKTALEDHERATELHEIEVSTWKESAKAAAKKGEKPPARPEVDAVKPVFKRVVVNDSTPEALHSTLEENPAGVLVIRDELAGLFDQFGSAGRESERTFYLTAWDGNGTFALDRVTRGHVFVEGCCLSLFGAIQPARLQQHLSDALNSGHGDDGLAQRLQVLVWPDDLPTWEFIDSPPDPLAERKAADVFERLLKMDHKDPLTMRFGLDAQEYFNSWLADLERNKIRKPGIQPAMANHLSKYPSLMPSIAAILQLAESSDVSEISLDNAVKAASICDFLESHANRIYSCIVTARIRAAHALADKITSGKIGASGTFTARDIYYRENGELKDPELAKQAAAELEAAGWIRHAKKRSDDPRGRGRPSDKYEINPRLVRKSGVANG